MEDESCSAGWKQELLFFKDVKEVIQTIEGWAIAAALGKECYLLKKHIESQIADFQLYYILKQENKY